MSAYGCLLGGTVGAAVFLTSVSKIGLCSWGPGQALCPQARTIVCAPSAPCHCSPWRRLSFPFPFSPIRLVSASPLRTASSAMVKERREGASIVEFSRAWDSLTVRSWWGSSCDRISVPPTSLIKTGLAVHPRVILLAPPTLPRWMICDCVWMVRKVVPSRLQGAHVHA